MAEMQTLQGSSGVRGSAAAGGGIQWGKVAKGALVVAGVVVAAVVAGWAVHGLATAVLEPSTMNMIAGTVVHYASVALQGVSWAAGQVYGLAASGLSHLAGMIGLGSYGLATAPAANAAGGAAALVAGGAATAGVVTHYFHADPATSSMLATKAGLASAAVDPHMAHTLNDMTHHAAEHAGGEHKSFAARFAPKDAAFTSHADAVRASQGERSSASAPAARDASFAKQLDADRANLESSLGTKIV